MAFGLPKSELTYADYLKIPELISLQKLFSDPPKHDEMLFIIIHQIYELWFKLILHELDGAVERLDQDKIDDAVRYLRRSIEIERILIGQIDVLETMRPIDFLEFRDHLMPASGLQSVQFREIEFLCGIKNRDVLKRYDSSSADFRRLSKRLEEPTLGDAFYRLLSRRGLKVSNKDETLQSLKLMYDDPARYSDLMLVEEALIEFDELFTRWRLIHVKMVERMIGSKFGTGGTEGVGYLKGTLDRSFFPELWEVRSLLGTRIR